MGRMILSAALLLSAPGAAASGAPVANASRADAWEIGPIIRGKNYSVGMSLHPTQARRGWHFEFPFPNAGAGHVHYLTFRHGTLTGKRRIVMRYRIDAALGVRFVPRETPAIPAIISLYFQRRGDNWSAVRGYDGYRWFAPASTVAQIKPGAHEMIVRLDEAWTSVNGVAAAAEPNAYRAAIAEADRVGFLLGSHQARGHGVYATGPARLTVISFQVT